MQQMLITLLALLFKTCCLPRRKLTLTEKFQAPLRGFRFLTRWVPVTAMTDTVMTIMATLMMRRTLALVQVQALEALLAWTIPLWVAQATDLRVLEAWVLEV